MEVKVTVPATDDNFTCPIARSNTAIQMSELYFVLQHDVVLFIYA